MNKKPFCIICHRKLNPKTMKEVGYSQEKGQYTLVKELATQGWFDIGADCLNTLKKQGKLLEDKNG